MEGIRRDSIVCANFVLKLNKCVGITAVQLLLQEKIGTRQVHLYPVYLGGNAFEAQGDNSN